MLPTIPLTFLAPRTYTNGTILALSSVFYTNLRSVISISHDHFRSGGLAPISANLKGQQSPDGQNKAVWVVPSADPYALS